MSENEPLYSPAVIRRVMDRWGIDFRKNFGQNFLIDGNIVRKIVREAGVGPQDTVLEIGPGIGTLTQELLGKAHRVISVEIDPQLLPILEDHFGSDEKFRLVEGDALKLDFAALLAREQREGALRLVANLPYYITTPLLKRFLTEGLPFQSLTVMVQKEVADRMTAAPSSKEYGSLTLFIQLYARAKRVIRAPKEVFMPSPKVDSEVVHLVLKQEGEIPQGAEELGRLFQTVFQQRRKTAINGFSRATGKSKSELRAVFDSLGLDPNLRPENLSLKYFIDLRDCLKKC